MPNRTPLLRLAALAALVLAAGLVRGPEDEPERRGGGAPRWLSAPAAASFEPHACTDAAGRLWTVWVSVRDAETEARVRLEGAVVADDGSPVRFAFPEPATGQAEPRLARDGDGVYCAFEADGGERARVLRGRALALDGGKVVLGALEELPVGPEHPLHPRLAPVEGGLLLVYQGWSGTSYDLYGARRGEDGWSEARALWTTDADEWGPELVAAPGGVAHLAFDRWDGASFDVLHARLGAERDAEPRTVAGGPDFQGYPELALDGGGRVWIAWEEAPQFGERGGLRDERRARLAAWTGGELRYAPVGALPQRGGRADFPVLGATAEGLRAHVRVPQRYAERTRKQRPLFTSWFSISGEFGPDEPPAGRRLELTEGGNANDEVLVARPDGGLWLLFTTDEREARMARVTEWGESIEGRWRVGLVELAGPRGFPELGAAPRATLRASAPPPGEAVPDGVRFGDLHRHTELSRCSAMKDGTLEDAYRYARGPGRLDFVAVADHYQHQRPWSWWRSLRDVERFHAPGALATYAAVERVAPARGHFNDVYRDTHGLRFDPERWRRSPARTGPRSAEDTIAIPHMMGIGAKTGFEWSGFRAERNRLVEVYQGLRGSYEGAGLPYEAADRKRDAADLAAGLAAGLHFGLVASSDHVSASDAFAGVHVDGASRGAIFDALRARRTFAATARRAVDARLGPLAMGAEGCAPPDAPFVVEVASDAPLAYVELVKNGATLARREGSGPDELVVLRLFAALGKDPVGPLELGVEGGRLRGARFRPAGEHGGAVEHLDDGRLRLSPPDHRHADLVVEVAWSEGAAGALVLERGESRQRLALSDLAPGRSRAADVAVPRVLVWRLGTPLGQPGGELAFPDPERADGDSYYARIAWTDGNLAWTSPIRVRCGGDGDAGRGQ